MNAALHFPADRSSARVLPAQSCAEPRILILDDALSAVDTYTEEEILKRLRNVMKGRTSIIISHRISTVKDADQIVVLNDGKIAERGTHDELVETGGIYAELHQKQLLEEELEQLYRAKDKGQKEKVEWLRILKKRTFEFALRIVDLAKALPRTPVADVLTKQLLRSGTSVGANVEESRAGYSKDEFAYKMNIALKEARETHYWLRLIQGIRSGEIPATRLLC